MFFDADSIVAMPPKASMAFLVASTAGQEEKSKLKGNPKANKTNKTNKQKERKKERKKTKTKNKSSTKATQREPTSATHQPHTHTHTKEKPQRKLTVGCGWHLAFQPQTPEAELLLASQDPRPCLCPYPHCLAALGPSFNKPLHKVMWATFLFRTQQQ